MRKIEIAVSLALVVLKVTIDIPEQWIASIRCSLERFRISSTSQYYLVQMKGD
jgi:hypothetical protein